MTLKILICIPTYNNPASIDSVAASALSQTPYSVLIVDDGSDRPVIDCLSSKSCTDSLAQGRLRIVRFEQNLGKGAALQAAFKEGVRLGYTHLLAIDGDGQHLLSEATSLIEAARQNPWDLIIGHRSFESADVPGISKFGRTFSNFWVGFQTGQPILDSQSGYRLYPLFHLQNARFFTKRYDFEIEVLIRLLWQGVGVTEVPIQVHYPKASERVSHFDKFWDNVRISALNTILVVLSLLRLHREPKAGAVATGVGVWIGCTPFFGFHTFLVACASFFFRLNAAYLFLGSQISIPPLAALLIPAEITVGREIFRSFGVSSANYALPVLGFQELLQFAGSHFLQWLAGSVLVGGVLGTAGGLATYFLSVRLKGARPGQKSNWTGKTRGGRFGNGFLKFVLKRAGLRAGYACLWLIIPYFYLFAPRARRAANEYWACVRPEVSYFPRQRLVMKQLFSFGQVLLDRAFQSFASNLISQSSGHKTFTTKPHGIDEILGPVRAQQPLILLTAHVGGWDLAASLLRGDGFLGQMHMVHYQFSGLTFDKVVDKNKSTADPHLRTVASNLTQDPIFTVKELLEKGKPVGLMGDRAMATNFELVSFCGKLAPFDSRPFRMAAATGSLLLFTFGFKGPGKTYELYGLPAIRYKYAADRPRNEQLREWVQEFAAALESLLSIYPEQWFNFYPFFSARPAPPPGVQAAKEQHSLMQEWRKPAKTAAASAPGARKSALSEFLAN